MFVNDALCENVEVTSTTLVCKVRSLLHYCFLATLLHLYITTLLICYIFATFLYNCHLLPPYIATLPPCYLATLQVVDNLRANILPANLIRLSGFCQSVETEVFSN